MRMMVLYRLVPSLVTVVKIVPRAMFKPPFQAGRRSCAGGFGTCISVCKCFPLCPPNHPRILKKFPVLIHYSLLPNCVQVSKKRDIARAKSPCLVLFPILTVQKVSNRQSPKAFDKVGVAKIVSTAWCNSSVETGIENFFASLSDGDCRIFLVLLMCPPGAFRPRLTVHFPMLSGGKPRMILIACWNSSADRCPTASKMRSRLPARLLIVRSARRLC